MNRQFEVSGHNILAHQRAPLSKDSTYKMKRITIATAKLLMRRSWSDKLFCLFFKGLQKQVLVFCHCHDLPMYLFENVVHKDTSRDVQRHKNTADGQKIPITGRLPKDEDSFTFKQRFARPSPKILTTLRSWRFQTTYWALTDKTGLHNTTNY